MFNLRLQARRAPNWEKPARLRVLRRDIARLETRIFPTPLARSGVPTKRP